MDPFVSWQWCRVHHSDIVIVDTRWYWNRAGVDAYRAGHIPGAVFVDLDVDLTGSPSEYGGRHPFPTSQAFAQSMGKAGIDGSKPIIAYDDAGGIIAARLVWMLRLLDIPAAVLSGGLAAFSGKLEAGDVQPETAVFVPRQWPANALLSTADVAAQTSGILIDARPVNRYRGQELEIDPHLGQVPDTDPRQGHIPGAVSVPCRNHLNHDGTIGTPERLHATFAAVGIEDAGKVISYCGSGVTACHNLLAMEYAGFGKGRLYPGSWSAWSRALHLPTKMGENP